jgi:DNA uptake protein ComE-like DNA-binding protein
MAAAAQPSASSSPAATGASTKVNLNIATREQFLAVPGVGDRMVREFEEYRPYTSVAQFRREIGKYVSQEQVAAYLQYVYVPVDANRADAETLQQLPGIDATDAAALIAARPYTSAESFLTALGQYVSADQVTVARAYLTAS